MRYYCISIRIATIKMTDITSVGKNVEKSESSYIAGGNVKGCNHFAEQFDSSLNVERRVTI